MKKILYYISDHGYGHATRSIALINELKRRKNEIVIRNTNSVNFLKKSIPDLKIIEGTTDVGPTVKNDGLSIDLVESKKRIGEWVESFEETVKGEEIKVKQENPDLIISDISAMPFVLASKLKIPSIAISNFSWYDTYDFLTNYQSKILFEAYGKADLAIQLPFGTSMEHFKKKIKVGVICRKVEKNPHEILKKLGIEKKSVILLGMGKTNNELTFSSSSEIKIISIGGKINDKNILDYNDYINGHELVSISDLVICKIGYGIISECVTNGIPFIYTTDENRTELKHIGEELKTRGLGIKMTEEEINKLIIDSKFINSLVKPRKIPIQNTKVAEIIVDFLK